MPLSLRSYTPHGLTYRYLVRLIVLYLIDWITVVGTIAFAGTLSFWAVPPKRPFDPKDPAISYPFTDDTVISTALLVVLAIILPGILILIACACFPLPPPVTLSRSSKYKLRRRIWALNSAWLGLGVAIAAGMLITDGAKNLVGRPRPDFLARCKPIQSRVEAAQAGGKLLVGWDVCEKVDEVGSGIGEDGGSGLLRDGGRSWPSGHSSMSFAGLTYLSLFLCHFTFSLPSTLFRPGAPSNSHHTTAPSVANFAPVFSFTSPALTRSAILHRDPPKMPIALGLLISAVPMMLAGYIASTRYTDFRHHPTDIISGALLGVFCAVLGWRWYGVWSVGEPGAHKYWHHEHGVEQVGEVEMDTGGLEAGERQRRKRRDSPGSSGSMGRSDDTFEDAPRRESGIGMGTGRLGAGESFTERWSRQRGAPERMGYGGDNMVGGESEDTFVAPTTEARRNKVGSGTD